MKKEKQKMERKPNGLIRMLLLKKLIPTGKKVINLSWMKVLLKLHLGPRRKLNWPMKTKNLNSLMQKLE